MRALMGALRGCEGLDEAMVSAGSRRLEQPRIARLCQQELLGCVERLRALPSHSIAHFWRRIFPSFTY